MGSTKKPLSFKSKEFFSSQLGIDVQTELLRMMTDKKYNTAASYSPTSEGGTLEFNDKHMAYLCSHLNVDTAKYLSNLKLITKIR